MNLRLFSTVAHMLVWIAVAACAPAEPGRANDSARAEPMKVALLTPGPISDRSWNGGAYQGLLAIRDSIGAVTSHIQTSTPAEFEENFRQYGAQGYDLVFGHGFEFQDAAERVAPEYPATVFIVTSGIRAKPPNVAPIVFSFDGASYLAGVIAGVLTRSGVVGTIGGTALPPVESSFRAFEAGARSQRPGIHLLSAYVGNWDDATAGRELAVAQIRRGADIIFQNADAAGLGVFQAARQAPGVRVFGSNADQNDVAPEVTLGSVVIDLPAAMLRVAREVHDRRFAAAVIRLGAASGVVRLVLNPARASEVPPSLHATLDSLQAAIAAGTFTAIDSTTTSPTDADAR